MGYTCFRRHMLQVWDWASLGQIKASKQASCPANFTCTCRLQNELFDTRLQETQKCSTYWTLISTLPSTHTNTRTQTHKHTGQGRIRCKPRRRCCLLHVEGYWPDGNKLSLDKSVFITDTDFTFEKREVRAPLVKLCKYPDIVSLVVHICFLWLWV